MPDLDFSTASAEEIGSLTPGQLIGHLKAMSDRDIDAVMASDTRGHVLAAIFETLPAVFRGDKAGSLAATTHWSITDRPDGGSDDWTVRIADGSSTVVPGHEGDSALSLAMAPAPFIKLITKSGNPVMLFMTGRIRATGDLSLAANFANLFDLPKV